MTDEPEREARTGPGGGGDDGAGPAGAAAVRGRIPASPRWRAARDLNNAGATALHAGDLAHASELLGRAIAATRGHDADGEALDLRARALLNLAAAREWRGAFAEALTLGDEGIAAADAAVALVGDERATRTVAVNGRLSRAQTLLALDRAGEALTELDAVAADLADLADGLDQRELLTASLHNARTGALITLGRIHEAEAEAHRTVDAAGLVAPELAAHAYANLAAIAQATGAPTAEEYLSLAAALQDSGADRASHQLILENRARAALQHGRDDEAADLFTRAEAVAREAGLLPRIAACRTGIAAIELRRGRVGRAVKTLRGLIAELDDVGAVHELREAHGFLGDAQCALGRYDEAQESYSRARQLARSVHERCRVDLRRAEAFAEQAAETPVADTRLALLHTALTIAVPVHLTTEALREDFPAGPARERWAQRITAPARELAFRLAVTLGGSELLHDLIENAAASATLRADATGSGAAEKPDVGASVFGASVVGTPAGTVGPATARPVDDDVDLLPAAAAGFAGTGDGAAPELRFALPPRVLPYPGAEPALGAWIERAEAVYGVPVRSAGVVVSW